MSRLKLSVTVCRIHGGKNAASSYRSMLPNALSICLLSKSIKKHGSCCCRKKPTRRIAHRLMVASLMHSVQLSLLKGNSDVLRRNKAHYFFASAVTAVFVFASSHSAAQQDIDRLGAGNVPQSHIQKKQAPSGSIKKVARPS